MLFYRKKLSLADITSLTENLRTLLKTAARKMLLKIKASNSRSHLQQQSMQVHHSANK